jgi:MFS family permease
VGRLIDRHGGRAVLAASNLVIAAGLIILAAAHGGPGLAIAWTVLGIGIGMGLYDPAFAALTWLYGREARSAITGISLIAGFASTIGWPLSAIFLHELGWRPACLIWAGVNMLLAAPLNWLILPRHGAPPVLPPEATELPATEPPRAAMPILAFFFATTWFVQGAMGDRFPEDPRDCPRKPSLAQQPAGGQGRRRRRDHVSPIPCSCWGRRAPYGTECAWL